MPTRPSLPPATRLPAVLALLGVSACAGGYLSDEGLLLGSVSPGDSVVVLAAGDIADCHRQGDEMTALLLDTLGGVVLALGDNAYSSGTVAEYRDCYDRTWGRHLPRTWAAAGNHDYHTAGAAGHFGYFGERAGPRDRGYYSLELPGWHVVVLNSGMPLAPESEQLRWLRLELMAHPAECTLAVIHHPRYSSGLHGNNAFVTEAWRMLYAGGTDLVLSGHDHVYERFRPMDPDGRPDPERGIRSFVVGTGGATLRPFLLRAAGSETRIARRWGVLRLRLRPGRYEWDFIAADGGASLDHGEDRCR